MAKTLIQSTEHGLYCAAGDFYIDPWRSVERAVVTHAHSDHASRGSQRYLTAKAGERVLRSRLGPEAIIKTLAYGESLHLNLYAVIPLSPNRRSGCRSTAGPIHAKNSSG